jgi:hypothetical protein
MAIDLHCPECGHNFDSINGEVVRHGYYTDYAYGRDVMLPDDELACPVCGETELEDYDRDKHTNKGE